MIAGSENRPVNIMRSNKKVSDREKILSTCKAFNAEPWIAIYVETKTQAELFLTSLKHYDEKYRSKKAKTINAWSMRNNKRI